MLNFAPDEHVHVVSVVHAHDVHVVYSRCALVVRSPGPHCRPTCCARTVADRLAAVVLSAIR